MFLILQKGCASFPAIFQLCNKCQTKLAKIREERPDRFNQMMS